jgi:hypothetical protein
MPLDTLEVVKGLKAAGFTDEQAEALTRVVRDAQSVDLSTLATKSDLQDVLAATKADLQASSAAIKADLQLGLAGAKTDLAETKAEILKWMVSAIGIQTVVIIGAVVALVRVGH